MDELRSLIPQNGPLDNSLIRTILMAINQNYCNLNRKLDSLEAAITEIRTHLDSTDVNLKCLKNGLESLSARSSVTNQQVTNEADLDVHVSLPVADIDEFKGLELQLADTMSASELKNTFLKLNMPDDRQFIYACLQTVFSKHFKSPINFKGHANKFALNTSRTWHLIKVAIGSKSNMMCTTAEHERFASDWLRGMRDRGRSRVRIRKTKANENFTSEDLGRAAEKDQPPYLSPHQQH